jgi:hypothetical protein
MAVDAVKITIKIFWYAGKAAWKVATFGFRAYKNHRDAKEAKLQEQLDNRSQPQQ